MGAGLSKEHRVLPLAVTALSPEQRRSRLDRRRRPDQPRPLLHHHHHQPPQVDDAPAAPAAALPGPEQPSAAVRGSVSPVGPAPPPRSPPATAPQRPPQQQLLQQPVAQQQRQSQGLRLSKLLPRRKQAVATLDLFDEDSPWWDPYLPDESARISPADGRDFAEGAPHDQTSPASPRSPGAAGIPFRNRPPTVIAAAAPPRSNAGVVVSLAGPVGRRKSRKLYPYAFSELQSTVDINLCSLGILKLSPHIGLLRSAVTMQLCCNSLTSLPPTFTNMRGLTHLDVSHNNLLHLPPNIGDLSKLVELRLADNRLVSLPPSIRQLSRLQLLSVARNELKSLPAEVGALERLVELDITGNAAVRYLPAEVGKLKTLKHVRVQGCGLAKEIPVPGGASAPRTGGDDIPRDQKARMPPLKELCARALLRWYPELQDVTAGVSTRSATRSLAGWSSLLSGGSPSSQAGGRGADGRAAPVDGITRNHSSKGPTAMASLAMRTSTSRSSLSSEVFAAHSSPGSAPPSSPPPPPAAAAGGSPCDSLRRRRRGRSGGDKGSKAQAYHHAFAAGPAALGKAPRLSRNLLAYLSSAHRCSFCGGPYLDWYVARYRFIDRKTSESGDDGAGGVGAGAGAGRNGNLLPLEYRLCSNHWETETGRLQAMFAPMPPTAASAWYSPRQPSAAGDR